MGGRLQGRTAVVTGAARGLGRAFAEGYAREGADVIAVDVLDGEGTAGAIRKLGRRSEFIKCDLASKEAIDAMTVGVIDRLGGCDVLMHCAAYQPHEPVEDIKPEQLRLSMAVNVEALVYMVQAFLPRMKERKWGRIIGISSTTIYDGTPSHAQYVASKSGLVGMIRVLAKELGQHGITVNAIAPGLVRTENSSAAVERMMELGYPNYFDLILAHQAIKRTLEPADLVGPAIFLASEESSCVTGQSLLVDGGWKHV